MNKKMMLLFAVVGVIMVGSVAAMQEKEPIALENKTCYQRVTSLIRARANSVPQKKITVVQKDKEKCSNLVKVYDESIETNKIKN